MSFFDKAKEFFSSKPTPAVRDTEPLPSFVVEPKVLEEMTAVKVDEFFAPELESQPVQQKAGGLVSRKLRAVSKKLDRIERMLLDKGYKDDQVKEFRRIKKAALLRLEQSANQIPDGANVGGVMVVYDKATGEIREASVQTKEDLLDVIQQAKSGKLSIVA